MIKIFTVPAFDPDDDVDEMNKFISSHRVIEVLKEFNHAESGGYWTFCIEYLQSGIKYTSKNNKPNKIDYKAVLSEEQFKVFSKLREIRKDIAKEEALPAYTVFTDKELSDISQLDEVNLSKLKTIEGIGEKRVERYGQKLIEEFGKSEKNGESDK
ncbi:MAG: HRDC domain-containing protein [Candidatus Delongbacteria bacterium]|nr:HRDC domain-containing protein [Candidatus Delongbacteria bacterium]